MYTVHTTTCVYSKYTGTCTPVRTMCILSHCLFLLHQAGESALDYARRDNRTDLIAYLEELGLSIVHVCTKCIIVLHV